MSSEQPAKARYLTKSRFKTAHECATKLAYLGRPHYGNTKDDDPFLKALAEGGFQVGALAKLYWPGGQEIETLDYEKSSAETQALLNRENVVIYEAALHFEKLFVRVDILVKQGDHVEIYEVKAKSYDPEEDHFFQKRSKEKKLMSEWEPFLYDIAFQDYVAKKALPSFKVSSFLYLVNKRVESSVERLNQNFIIRRLPNGRPKIETKQIIPRSELGNELLAKIPVQEEINVIHSLDHNGKTFEQYVEYLANAYTKDSKINTPIGSQCKDCEFRISEEDKAKGLKSGFEECWNTVLSNKSQTPLVIDLWDNRSSQKQISSRTFLLTSLTKEEIAPEPREDGPGISRRERQWIQIEKAKTSDPAPFLDKDGLSQEINRWKYPFHFIDFETAQPAIPFNKGRRPYEQIAFQFSHHVVYEDGRIEHAGEYINTERGKFPNFEFIKNLKGELDKDEGTIFRYAAHENTILCKIYDQLPGSGLPKSDVDELQQWIRTITKRKTANKKDILWQGDRNMVDMRDLVLRYYYHPLTEGSNSIKYVLPATLNESTFLQNLYSQPIYGAAGGMKSRNFRNKKWIQRDQAGKVLDPYKTLEPIFTPEEDRLIEVMYPETEIADGGAAMMAYARMQFTEMSTSETQRIRQALLRYCELDTLAMVFLFQYWQSEIQEIRKKNVS
jgi:hypothetical protein